MPKWHLLICLLIISVINLLPMNSLKAETIATLPEKAKFVAIMQHLSQRFGRYFSEYVILIVVSEQKQYLLHHGTPIARYTISTSEFGVGNQAGSNKTPLGVHIISEKFGENAEIGTIFKARTNTGKVAKILTEAGKRSKADNVTTRILWLSGLEKGINKGHKIDSHQRYIYIHGTDEEGRLGAPASHGCIRMRNHAVIHLYQQVPVGTLVMIIP
ncbi:MAG: L,D-transpeptidase [Cocleimonas sp.]|nr:L,D-transpeptidase [Cocleimonas sp.]